jgi:translation initiation factor IF-2
VVRKRIKTFAQEMSLGIDEMLASCGRLRLIQARSASSLLTAGEARRVKAEIAEKARRDALLLRETVVETNGGKAVEKRLNETVVRRRHAAAKAEVRSTVTTPAEAAPFIAPRAEEIPAVWTSIAEPSATARPPLETAHTSAAGPVARTTQSSDRETPTQSTTALRLTSAAHASLPMIDDGPRRPKVLGKIDLRAVAARPARPSTAAPVSRSVARPGAPLPSRHGAHPSMMPRTPRTFVVPAEAGKHNARPARPKTVVRKDPFDAAAERAMRTGRIPRKRAARPGKEQLKTEITTPKASKRIVQIIEGVTVADLARKMGVKAAELISKLMALGMMATLNQVLDTDTTTLVASEFGYKVENVAFDAEALLEESASEDVPVARPPVVTVMGHVDHGKTSLLDAMRHTNVTEQEFGGITQHIGAYMVEANGREISFVDTPGHEAFTAMRARGARVTDIVVLVVAADEGVMPQTVEAINHARAAGVPIIVALNKIDRPEANVERVKRELSEHGLIPEDYSGDIITVPLSARTGEGIARLLEMILLQADVMELKANPARLARGTVIESQLDRGRGPVATVLIQEGTLHRGDAFVCGVSHGRVRAMRDHAGRPLSEAGPSTPVEICGLSSVPEPGTPFAAVREEAKARQVAEYRASRQRQAILRPTSRVSLEDLSRRTAMDGVKELRVIIRGDVHGSAEALSDLLRQLSTDEVKLEVIHASAGAVSEADVTLAAASDAVLIGFNVRPDARTARLAEKEGMQIRLYTVIYEALDDIRSAMEGLLEPSYREQTLGRAEVRRTFMVQGAPVAGAIVTGGRIRRGERARLLREGRVIQEGRIASLKRFKDDAREVVAGYECGIGIENCNDIRPGDAIENYELEAVRRKFAAPKAASAYRSGAAAAAPAQAMQA